MGTVLRLSFCAFPANGKARRHENPRKQVIRGILNGEKDNLVVYLLTWIDKTEAN